MTDASPYTTGDEPLFLSPAMQLGYPAQLLAAEVFSRATIDPDSRAKQERGRQPSPAGLIKRDCAPVGGHHSDKEPEQHPQGQKNAIRRSPQFAPAIREGMNGQPEGWNRRINNARQPGSQIEESDHRLIATLQPTEAFLEPGLLPIPCCRSDRKPVRRRCAPWQCRSLPVPASPVCRGSWRSVVQSE